MIRLADLTKRYGKFTAVDGISLHVPRGELFGLLGPNGAGKTTTMRMIAGILRPSSGSISVAGIDLLALNQTQTPLEALFFMLTDDTTHQTLARPVELTLAAR